MNMQQDQEIYEETLKDKLTLGPVEKYEKYQKFPWKYILQLLIIVGTSYQVRIITQYDAEDSRNFLYVMNSQVFGFTNFDYVYNKADSPQIGYTQFLTLTDFFNNLKQLFNVMGNLDHIFFTELDQQLINQTNNTINVSYKNPQEKFYLNQSSYMFNLQDGVTNPFDLTNQTLMKALLQKVAKIKIQFHNIEFSTPDKEGLDLLESWTVTMTYTLTDLFTIDAALNAQEIELNRFNGQQIIPYPFLYSYFWMIHLLVFIMSISSLGLHLKYIQDMVVLYSKTKFKSNRFTIKREQILTVNQFQDYEQQYLNPEQNWMGKFDTRGHKQITKIIQTQKPWNMLTLDEKLLFLDVWVIVTIVGNILQTLTSTVLIFNLQNVSFQTVQLLIGFSCFFAWLAICRYIEYQENVYILTYLLKYSLPNLLRFFLGVMPFFIGYTILGLTLFYNVGYFSSFQEAFVTLICLSYGNMIYELAYMLGDNVLATLFVLTYSVIFLIMFQNILMTIFVVMVYNKFDALVKQDMLDYLQTKIPNLNELLQNALQQEKIKGPDGSASPVRNSPNISPHQTAVSNEYPPMSIRNQYVTRIKSISKKIQKSIQKMSSDLHDDLKIFLITKKNDKKHVRQMNEVYLEYLIQKTSKIVKRTEKIKSLMLKQQ